MFVLPVGSYTPVAPIAPVAPIVRKSKSAEKSSADRLGGTRPTRSALTLASNATRAALDEMKLGG